jgi:hypothetical protein
MCSSLAYAISSLPPEVVTQCPLHIAMDELARASVKQDVLYMEGECLPRPELMAELDRWVSLHSLIHSRICVATRSTPLADSEFKSETGRMRGDGEPSSQSERLVMACAVCNLAQHCPLGSRADQLS